MEQKRNRFRNGNNLDNRVKSGSIVENMLEIYSRRGEVVVSCW